MRNRAGGAGHDLKPPTPALRTSQACPHAHLLDPLRSPPHPKPVPQVAYNPLGPGETRTYQSFVTHPWIVRDVATGARMLLNDTAAVVAQGHDSHVDIFAPPVLAWAVSGRGSESAGMRPPWA